MLSFLTAVLYPLFNKMDMMFRRAGAMRCNCIFLHQEEPTKRLMEEEGRRGRFLPLGFWCLMTAAFGLQLNSGGVLLDEDWDTKICLWAVLVLRDFFYDFGSKYVFFLSTIFSKFFCKAEFKSCSLQVFLVLWMSKRHRDKCVVWAEEITLEQLHAEGSAGGDGSQTSAALYSGVSSVLTGKSWRKWIFEASMHMK